MSDRMWYNKVVAPIRLVALVREGKRITWELDGNNSSLPILTLHHEPAKCSVRYKDRPTGGFLCIDNN